ncbi:MAG TPA: HAD-IA family hydrolase [Gemmatimonadaceae bacterium]|nr:HAD-IA family hydrolase [Gemmatimonadaceae bacterium]
MSRPHAILFDLDGTLLDTIELLLGSMRHAFAEHPGRRPTTDEWIAGIGTPLRTQLGEFLDSHEKVEQVVARYRSYQQVHHDRLMRCYDDVLDTLEALHARGHPLGIVTSKMNDLMNRGLERVGIAHLITAAVGCDSCARHKPDPEPVLVALQQLGYQPREAMFVGDSPHDMNAGRAAGVTTIAALWGPFTRDDLAPTEPDHWLDRIADLPALVRELQATPQPGSGDR